MPLKITSEFTHPYFKIRINGKVHLQFIEQNLIGFQSWIEGNYKIEFYFKEGMPILVEYNTIEKWNRVLELLEQL